MRKVICQFLLLFLCPCLLFAQPTFRVVTENLPPFNFMQDGKVIGISAEVVRHIFHEAGYSMEQGDIQKGDIQMCPWARAYYDVQHSPNTVLFSMARTENRESLFQWVGPISNVTIGVIAKKQRKIKIATAADFTKYRIGSVRDGAPEQLLIKAGVDVESLQRLAFPEMNIKKLQADRIDMFPFNLQTSQYLMLNLGMNPDDYEIVFTLKKKDLYIALHKDTDSTLVASLQAALDRMKQPGNDGISPFEHIVSKYLSGK